MDDCASLTLLKRIIPVPEPKPRQEAADVIYGEPYPDSIKNEEDEKHDAEMNDDDDDDEPYRFTLLDYRPGTDFFYFYSYIYIYFIKLSKTYIMQLYLQLQPILRK